VWVHFQEDRSMAEAASLAYTSLLSLVPLLAVVFGVTAAFPVFNEWADQLQAFILQNFMPSTGEQIAPYLDTFLLSVKKLTLPGLVALIVTALLLLTRIEVAFNRIWRVEKNRTWLSRIVMYWAVLTLVPILIGTVVAISAQSVFGLIGGDEGSRPVFYRFAIFLVTWFMFTTMFMLVPNRSVHIKHAVTGAFLSAVLFELAKWGFVGYAANANYTVLYGALATVPIFLFWIYLAWIVVLFGASLAASLTTFSDYSRYETVWPRRWEFQLAFRLIGHLRDAQMEGKSLSRTRLLELETQASELQLLKLIGRMREENIVTIDDEGGWLLARDLGDVTLGDLYAAGDYFLPLGDTEKLPRKSAWDDAFVDSLEGIAGSAGQVWQQSIRKMHQETHARGKQTR
jgi:membrane protein